MVCVPGNHDIAYEDPPRSADDLNRIFKDFSYQKHLADELNKQQAFFHFSKVSNCFKNKSVFDRKVISVDDFKVEINMINSAVFSLKGAEDKGLHYIEQTAINPLNTPTGADFVISVMHHAPDWYIDTQKNQLETALLCKSSLIFYYRNLLRAAFGLYWLGVRTLLCGSRMLFPYRCGRYKVLQLSSFP